MNIAPVSRERHGDKAWRRPVNYSFAADLSLVPLVGSDLATAAVTAPIAFVEKDGRYQVAHLHSPLAGQNLFVDPSGRWLGAFVPACLRTYPFRVLSNPETGDALLCVDEDSGLVTEPGAGAEPFFDEAGVLGPLLQSVMAFLTDFERSRKATEAAVAGLAAAQVIKPWDLTVRHGETDAPVAGLNRIDEAALMELPDDIFLELRRIGALPVAYAQILSMGVLDVFSRLMAVRAQLTPPPAAAPGQGAPLSEEMIESALAALAASSRGA